MKFCVFLWYYSCGLFRFISINGNKKFQHTTSAERRRSTCLSSPLGSPIGTTTSWVYAEECNLCSKFRVSHNTSRVTPYSIKTSNAVNAINAAAAVKNKKLYDKVRDLDLIEREFKEHKYFYQDFTHGCASGVASVKKNSTPQNSPRPPTYEKGDFDKVKEFITSHIIEEGQCISMKILSEIYGLGVGDTKYRSKLKQRLKNYFKDSISFLPSTNKNIAEIVANTDCVTGTFVVDKESQIRAAAKSLKEDILNKYDELQDLNWPPTSEELQEDSQAAPKSLCIFLEMLIKYDNHSRAEKQARLIASVTQDIVFAVTRGKVMQLKHFLLA